MNDEKLKQQIGANIALYRKAAGWTQAGLAERLNYSDKAVSKWERGESLPDVYVLTRIAEQYGISVGVLIGESQPEIQDSPYLHVFIFSFSVALTFLVATILIVTFEIFNVPFNTWLFFLYAGLLSALEAVIFTSLWWGLWRQLAAWSSLIWLGGLTVLLTIPGIVATKSLMICAALQAMVVFWILFRRSRIPKEEGLRDEE